VSPPALAETAAAAEAAFGLDRQDRVLIQRALQDLGVDPGPADGVLGPSSRNAIRDYQAGAGAVSTGYLTRAQAIALLDHGAALQERERVAAQPAAAMPSDRPPGEVFNDCNGEGWCPEMVVVPAGSFLMGSPEDEAARSDNEGPQHRVTIAEPFAIGVYEVTFDEWDACVADGGCNGYRPDDADWGRGRRPVIYVSWDDAQAYVDWLSNRTREEYRLPSEAEWEYAARAGTTTRYWSGDEIAAGYANFDRNVGRTIEVGSLARPNAFGLHDVHGNVWEWIEDCWNGSYVGAPANGSAWTSGNCDWRVLRGGSWNDYPWYLRSAHRSRFEPGFRFNFGFRVARTLR
jgi:formylglycine-generating enzyme required for sulfatase activity